jgi:hypothetical protein
MRYHLVVLDKTGREAAGDPEDVIRRDACWMDGEF